MDKLELVSAARQPTLGVQVSPLPIAHAPCVQGVPCPSTRTGGVKCDDPGNSVTRERFLVCKPPEV